MSHSPKTQPPADSQEPLKSSERQAVGLRRFVRKPRHKWFSAPDRLCEDGWYGPHDTIEAAVIECASNSDRLEYPIFVAQGYKTNKTEREDWGVEFDWQVESENAIEVKLPND